MIGRSDLDLLDFVQNPFISRLQRLERRPVLVQHYLKNRWHQWSYCSHRQPYLHRSVLKCEVVFDLDNESYELNAHHARKIVLCMQEEGAEPRVFATGGRGLHVCLYLDTPQNADPDALREAVWRYFMVKAGVSVEDGVDPACVRWSSKTKGHLLKCLGHKRRTPYTYLERIDDAPPTTIANPPEPKLWTVPESVLSTVAVKEKRKLHDHETRDELEELFQGAPRDMDPCDFDLYTFLKDFCEPGANFHDEALRSLALFLKTAVRLPEDEAVGYFARYWRPHGDCSSESHRNPEARVRSLFQSKHTFDPRRAHKMLKDMGAEMDEPLWRLLFHKLPLKLHDGEERWLDGCGRIVSTPCADCGRAIPREEHCGVTLCPECFQYGYLKKSMRYREMIQWLIETRGCHIGVLKLPKPITDYHRLVAMEKALRHNFLGAEAMRIIRPDRLIWVSEASFEVPEHNIESRPLKNFRDFIMAVVPFKSLLCVLQGDVGRATEWGYCSFRRHIFQPFGWERYAVDDADDDDREGCTIFRMWKEPPTCPYCGAVLSQASTWAEYISVKGPGPPIPGRA